MFLLQSESFVADRTDTLDSDSSASRVYGYSVVVGIGGGAILMSSFGATPAVVAPNEALDAVGALSVAQGMGLVFFISVAGIIYQSLGYSSIAPLVPADKLQDARDLLAGSSSNLFATLDGGTASRVTDAIVKALDNTYLPAVAVASLSLLCSLTLGVRFYSPFFCNNAEILRLRKFPRGQLWRADAAAIDVFSVRPVDSGLKSIPLIFHQF